MKAVIYTRVSTERQVDGLSLPVQEESCLDYCRREGFEVDRVFVERGESAKSVDRPEFQRMLEYCRSSKGKISVLVVYNLSRFCRDLMDHLMVRRSLMSVGVTVRAVRETIEDTASGRFFEAISAAKDQFDNERRSEVCKAGMQAAVARGRWVWRTPLGFVSAHGSPGGLLLDEKAAPLIRRGFEAVAAGVTPTESLRELAALGLRHRDGRAVSQTTWSKILCNPLYKGYLVVAEWGVEKRAAFPAVVDEITYARVEATLGGDRRRGRRRSRENPDFPLRAFLRCGHCDTPLTAAWQRGRGGLYAYYWCRHHCEKPSRRERIEGAWVEYLDRIRPTPATFDLMAEAIQLEQEGSGGDLEARRSTLRARISRLEKEKARLFKVYAYDEAIDKAAFQVESDRLNLEISVAQSDLAALEGAEGVDAARILREARAVVLNPARLWQEAHPALKCEFQAALFPRGGTYASGAILNCPPLPIFRDLRTVSGRDEQVVDQWPAALNHDWTAPLVLVARRFAESGIALGGRP